MAEIKLNKEQIEALQNCKTKEEVAKFAKENQLTDEELEKVVGGMAAMVCQGERQRVRLGAYDKGILTIPIE